MKVGTKLLGLMLVCSWVVVARADDQDITSTDAGSTQSDAPYYHGLEPFIPRVSSDAFTFNWENRLPMKFRPWAYLRLGYENVDKDDRFTFVGRTNGFYLDSTRLGVDASLMDQLTMRVSLEAASDLSAGTNTPLGQIDVRLRDGLVRWDPVDFIGIQAGQFETPFDAEDMRSTSELLFVTRAVGQQGVMPGQGLEQPSLAVDRQLGVMLSSRGPIPLSRFGLTAGPCQDLAIAYYVMGANGNGQDQLLNDNSELAWIGRLEATYGDIATLGGAYLTNRRLVGVPPNQYTEKDSGYDIDLMITPLGDDLELFGQFVQVKTQFPTVGTSDQIQQAWHVQIGYRIHTPWVHITPAYRFARFDPWAGGSGSNGDNGTDLNAYRLDYHTFGLRIGLNDLPLLFFINYTKTLEQPPRELHNNLLQLLAQVSF